MEVKTEATALFLRSHFPSTGFWTMFPQVTRSFPLNQRFSQELNLHFSAKKSLIPHLTELLSLINLCICRLSSYYLMLIRSLSPKLILMQCFLYFWLTGCNCTPLISIKYIFICFILNLSKYWNMFCGIGIVIYCLVSIRPERGFMVGV